MQGSISDRQPKTREELEAIVTKLAELTKQGAQALQNFLNLPSDELTHLKSHGEAIFLFCNEANILLIKHSIPTFDAQENKSIKHSTVGCLRVGLAIVEGEKEPSAGKERIQTLLRFANENAETGIDLFYDDLDFHTLIPAAAKRYAELKGVTL